MRFELFWNAFLNSPHSIALAIRLRWNILSKVAYVSNVSTANLRTKKYWHRFGYNIYNKSLAKYSNFINIPSNVDESNRIFINSFGFRINRTNDLNPFSPHTNSTFSNVIRIPVKWNSITLNEMKYLWYIYVIVLCTRGIRTCNRTTKYLLTEWKQKSIKMITPRLHLNHFH